MVRLFSLWHRRRAGVQQNLLSDGRPGYRPDPLLALLLADVFIRPIGGVIFAHIGDRIGRKKTLVLTLSLMGSATVAIGLLPTYEMVGLWAPALLITLRIIQGMGIGGEWGGALLLAYEYAPEKRKGFSAAFPGRGDHRHVDGDIYRLADDAVR